MNSDVQDAPDVRGYVLTERVGRGAVSTVWAARCLLDGTPVAVKVTPAGQVDEQQARGAAARERTILAGVANDHIVRLRDVVPLDHSAVALVLDLADGGSLDDLVSVRGRLTPAEVVTVFTPVATALRALHEAGVIHGDLSPGNILLTGEGKPMLSDFDAAGLFGHQQDVVRGTPGFVAPEVGLGAPPTPASDVWALGAVIRFALTGERAVPFGEVDDLVPAGLDPACAAVLSATFASDPGDRPAADEVARRIYQICAPSPVRLVVRRRDPASALTHRIRQAAAEAEGPEDDATRASRRRRWRTAARCSRPLRGCLAGSRARVVRLIGSRARIVGLTTAVLFCLSALGLARGWVATPGSAAHLDDPTATVQRLADARAAALMAADPQRLGAALAPGSAAHTADEGVLAALRVARRQWADLSFRVRSARLIRLVGDSAEVTAVIDRSAYTVTGDGVPAQHVAAAAGQPLTYALTLTAQGWRIADVSAD